LHHYVTDFSAFRTLNTNYKNKSNTYSMCKPIGIITETKKPLKGYKKDRFAYGTCEQIT